MLTTHHAVIHIPQVLKYLLNVICLIDAAVCDFYWGSWGTALGIISRTKLFDLAQ